YKELKNKINPILRLYANDPLRLPYLYFYLAESDYYLNNPEDASRNYLKSSQGFKDPKIQVLARLGLGWSYLKLNKYKEAEEVLYDIKQNILDKKSLDILILGQAGLMSATNRIYEAKKLYSQVISLTADSFIAVQAHMGLADAFFNLAEYDQAAQNYKAALDKVNGSVVPAELIAKLQYNLGLSYIRMGKIDEGSEMLKKSVAKNNDRDAEINLLIQLGENYAVQGELLKSEDSFKKILAKYPDSPGSDYAQYQIGLLQLKRSDYNAAALSFELFLEKIKQSEFLPQATYSLGLAYFHKGDYQKSIELFSRFQDGLKTSQLRPQAFYMMGTAYIMLEKINNALDIFKEIPKLDFQDAELLQKAEYEIADCYYKLGQENEAAAKFKYLRAKYPDSKLTSDILWWLGKYYYRQNDFKVARRYFTSLTRDYPDNSLAGDAFYALGLIDNDENKFTDAGSNFKKAIERGSPELILQSRIALGDVYFQQGSFEEAIGQYKGTIKENPGLEKMVLPRIADAYYRAGDYGNAKNFYSKSIGIADDKEVAGIRFNLGEVLEAMGQFEEAAQQYLQAADLNKGYPELHTKALLRAAKLYEDKEDFKTALKIYNRVPQGVDGSKLAHEKIQWIKSGKK
ncbi:MAG: tetratricopeptide repeat protein, partial [Candidatus Omnitrophota bacterium]